jgi:hypothetical protein
VRAQAEFRRVGLADDHGTGPSQARDHGAVGGGHMIAKGGRAIAGHDPGGFGQILDRHGQTLQRSGGGARGLVQQRVAVAQRHDGIDRGVSGVDPVQRFRHQLLGCEGSGAQGGQLMGRVMIDHGQVDVRLSGSGQDGFRHRISHDQTGHGRLSRGVLGAIVLSI